jgi:oligopeptide transport system ATP-binding protein
MGDALVSLNNVKKYFPVREGFFQRQTAVLKAVDGISFDIGKGEAFGLVGESGCGKSTAGRTLLQLYRLNGGSITFEDIDISLAGRHERRYLQANMQMIFQDPYASLNPRMTAGAIVEAPLIIHGQRNRDRRRERVRELFDLVGLHHSFLQRYPHEFSGGQRQRIGIARALALNPKFVVCDEAIAALDVSVQAQIVNMLQDFQVSLGLTYLFIAHDLSMVRHLCQRVAVMYLGKIVEIADVEDLFTDPLHPYTRALLAAVPVPDPLADRGKEELILEGELPNPAHPPSGCSFSTRCPNVEERCRKIAPQYETAPGGRGVSCHFAKKPV